MISADKQFLNFLIIYKINEPDVEEAILPIVKYLCSLESSVSVMVEEKVTNKYSDLPKVKSFKLGENVDLCIAVGGDGTVLWANSLFKDNPKPLFLTFNYGTVGYLTYHFVSEWQKILDGLISASSSFSVETRCTLQGTIHKADKQIQIFAMNDIVLEKSNKYLIDTNVYINDQLLSCIRADGIILASSTGSSAYNLSANGPIVQFDSECMVLNAICPFTMSFRPLCLPKEAVIKLEPKATGNNCHVTPDCIDYFSLEKGDYLVVQLSDTPLLMIVMQDFVESPTKLWQEKLTKQLGWNSNFV